MMKRLVFIQRISKMYDVLLALTVSFRDRFTKFFYRWKECEIFYKTFGITHDTLSMLLHFLGKSKVHTVSDAQ